MPISFKYTWTESEDAIEIKIPFKGKSIENTDIYLSDVFLKVSHPPVLLVLDLAREIIVNSSKAIKQNDVLLLHLPKATGSRGKWKSLSFKGSKTDTMHRRNASIVKRQEEVKHSHEKARDTKLEEERMTLKKQMAIDQNELDRIEEIKRHEKKVAEDAVYQALSQMKTSPTPTPLESPKLDKEKVTIGGSIEGEDITKRKEGSSDKRLAKKTMKKMCNLKKQSPIHIVSVRQPGIVKFKHTARYFKTPSRESTHLQEEIFLAKNKPYLKHNKYFNHVDGSPSASGIGNTDPIWLKRKGDEFYTGEDYLSAINAYTEAVEKDETFLQAITNRAACYMLIGEFGHTIQDCNHALNLLDAHAKHKDAEFNKEGSRYLNTLKDDKCRDIREEVLIRLASAHCQLEDQNPVNCLSRLQKAKIYLHEAVSLHPNDDEAKSLKHNMQSLQQIIKAQEHKRDGDIAFGLGNADEAILLYNQAIKEDTTNLSAHANRAAAHYLIHDYTACVSDCTYVLETLKAIIPLSTYGDSPMATFGGIPTPGSSTRSDLVKVCLCRRAAAYLMVKSTSLANQDSKAVSKWFGESCLDLCKDEKSLL